MTLSRAVSLLSRAVSSSESSSEDKELQERQERALAPLDEPPHGKRVEMASNREGSEPSSSRKSMPSMARSLSTRQTRSVFGPGAVHTSAYSLLDVGPGPSPQYLPPAEKEAVIMEGVLKKRVVTVGHTVEWRDRFVTMTDDKLYIRNEQDLRVRDSIALLDITHVKTMVELEHSSKEEGRRLPQTGSHGSLRSLSSHLYGTSTGEKRTLSQTGSSGSLGSLSSYGTGIFCQKEEVDSALGWTSQAATLELSVDPIQTHLAATTEHSPHGQTKVSPKKDLERDWMARRDTSETVDILQGEQSTTGVRFEGHVRKRGRINTEFQARFFVLTDDMLSYYKTEDTNRQARGGIKCINIETVQASTTSMQGTYEFTVTDTNGRRLVCSVPTEESQQAWIQQIYAATVDSSALARSPSRPSREQTSPHTASFMRRNAIRPEATQATQSSDSYRSEWSNALKIYAERYGRTYYLRASSSRDTEKWTGALQTAIQEAWVRHKRDYFRGGARARLRAITHDLYLGHTFKQSP